jgi:predicted TIM-barrel fold metal-dependent hydrolase
MYQGIPVIDVHGHISTPPQFRAFAYNLIALRPPGMTRLKLKDEAFGPALQRHLRIMDERNIDVQLVSPRPIGMMHWERARLVHTWTRVTNDVIAQICRLHPNRFIGVGQLPQNSYEDGGFAVEELERCVKELGFVGAILNPDPGGDRRTPGVDEAYWHPLYARAEALGATLVVHPSITRDPRLERIKSGYQFNNLTEETLATLLYEQSDVFARFPRLKVVVCHCGGSPRRLLQKGLPLDAVAQERGRGQVVGASGEHGGGQAEPDADWEGQPPLDVSGNLFFDTCAYDPYFLDASIRQRGVSQMVFGTEAPGSGSSQRNPATGRPADDVLATLEQLGWLTPEEIGRIVHGNALEVFPLLKERLGAQR